jgi:hypothetical protein
MDHGIDGGVAQKAREQSGGRCAVDVVVAESSSGRSCRCAIASARADPRSSSRLRQARPVAELSTPRKIALLKAQPA